MVLGAFAAMGQTNIKRLLAYSSIGQHRFRADRAWPRTTPKVRAGVLIYLAIYVAMTLGAFACVLAMQRDGRNVEKHLRPFGPRENEPHVRNDPRRC